MAKLATTRHPYAPAAWLDKEQAMAYLAAHGFTLRLTMAFCRANSIEVASTGHISLLCLEQYIKRRRFQAEQDQIDLPPETTERMIVPMLDEVEDDEYPRDYHRADWG